MMYYFADIFKCPATNNVKINAFLINFLEGKLPGKSNFFLIFKKWQSVTVQFPSSTICNAHLSLYPIIN